MFTPDEPVVYTAVDSDEPCIGAAPAEPDVIDDCGPNNAYYTNVPESTEEYTVVAEPAEKPTTITITANDGFVFEPDAPVIYTVEDSNTPCPATAPDEPAVTDDCGPDNAYFTTVPESTEEYTVVAEPAEKPTTITITANEGFVFTPDAPVIYTVEDSGDLCVVVAPEEPDVTDECGPDNAYYTTVPESTDEYTVVAEPEVNPTKITITATEGNAFDEQDTLVIVYEVTDSGEACPIYVACVYPTAQVDDVAPRVALSLIPKGVLAIIDQAEALLNGFLGTFPYTYAQGASEVKILQELPEGVDLSAFDAATLCGAVAGIVE
ncbi:hypothetical protein, partial [Nocardioides sp. GCM10030258]|uniref:hypothetical protein n=1 Tax=unclassified Nocardioides TaxID=2615069 RepID=UPI00361A704D